jgi:hypothetical protein
VSGRGRDARVADFARVLRAHYHRAVVNLWQRPDGLHLEVAQERRYDRLSQCKTERIKGTDTERKAGAAYLDLQEGEHLPHALVAAAAEALERKRHQLVLLFCDEAENR